MTKSMLFFIGILIVALGARPVLAGDGREYVGETTVTTSPDVGLFALHALCDADFPGARMCSSSDIIRNGGVGAPLPADLAYITPVLVDATIGFPVDASGFTLLASSEGNLSCAGWRVADISIVGFALNSAGLFTAVQCVPLPVACCGFRKEKKIKK